MPIYEFAPDRIQPLSKTTFGAMQLHERRDLQRLLRENIEVIAPDTLVIAEEYGEWDESRRRIDLLGIDRDANLVVIELKRTEDGVCRLVCSRSLRLPDRLKRVSDMNLRNLRHGHLAELRQDVKLKRTEPASCLAIALQVSLATFESV
jgi:hypothetical protein